MTDTAALLHGQRGFFYIIEDRRHIVPDPPHNKTVEQRHLAARTGTGKNAPARQKGKIPHHIGKA